MKRLKAEHFREIRGRLDRLGRTRGEIHEEKVSLAVNRKHAALRVKDCRRGPGGDELEDGEGRRKRGVAAKIYLNLRSEPAQVAAAVGPIHKERRLRQIVLKGYRLQEPVFRPCVEEADACGVARKDAACEGVDLIERNLHAHIARLSLHTPGRSAVKDISTCLAQKEKRGAETSTPQ